MAKMKLTVSLDEDVALYLREHDNVSLVVQEAVVEYQARRLEAELETAYCEDAAEALAFDREWSAVDETPE